MSKISDAVNAVTKDRGDAWQGARQEPNVNDRRIRDEVIVQLNAAFTDTDIAVLCAEEIEALARKLASYSSAEDVAAQVKSNGLPEISALTGMAAACNDAAHSIWEEQYHPLEVKLG